MSQSTSIAVEEFVERMGLVAEGDGLPRIAGRIMGLMVIEGGPVSFAQLAQRLEISRGSVSTNTRFLERLGVIERITIRGDRQDYFQLSKAPYAQLLRGSAERLSKAGAVVSQAKTALSDSDLGALHRLDELGEFYKALNDSFKQLAARFSKTD
ncbi:hypothetical protein BAL199_10807 [alpha proteobacterium BAL199]|jgi:DNA-binding transcriptional regulator GbsR (MarR family)|nr:hypothetical protein BAL199_10807 [alpha proteobacterium BAL199]